MAKRSKGRELEDCSHPFSVKTFNTDYAVFTEVANASGIPKSILFRLVMREAGKSGVLHKVANVRR